MKTTDTYSQVIQKTTGMVRDKAVQRLAQKHGLHVLDVTWEDTARFDFSAVGPNISDMTIVSSTMCATGSTRDGRGASGCSSTRTVNGRV